MIYIKIPLSTEEYPLFPVGEVLAKKNTDGSFEINATFAAKDNTRSFIALLEESFIYMAGFTFRVKQIKKDARGLKKTIKAQHIFFDNSWAIIYAFIRPVPGGTKFSDYVPFALSGTGFTYTANFPLYEVRYIADFGQDNIVSLIQKVCAAYECGFEITSDKHLHFSRGSTKTEDLYLLSYTDNIVTMSETISTENLRTVKRGIGKDGLTTVYISPSFSRWGQREADPLVDESIENGLDLLQLCKNEIVDVPEIDMELSVIDLPERKLNENVWLLHKPMNFQTIIKIVELTNRYNYTTGEFETISLKLGNFYRTTLSDEIINIGLNAKRNARTVATLSDGMQSISADLEGNNYAISQISSIGNDQQLIMSMQSEMNRMSQEIESLNARLYQQEAR